MPLAPAPPPNPPPRPPDVLATRSGTEPEAVRTHAPPPRLLHAADLFGDAHEILIEHRAQLYRLRRTSLGKLILTK